MLVARRRLRTRSLPLGVAVGLEGRSWRVGTPLAKELRLGLLVAREYSSFLSFPAG